MRARLIKLSLDIEFELMSHPKKTRRRHTTSVPKENDDTEHIALCICVKLTIFQIIPMESDHPMLNLKRLPLLIIATFTKIAINHG